jgi:hypothetical protein
MSMKAPATLATVLAALALCACGEGEMTTSTSTSTVTAEEPPAREPSPAAADRGAGSTAGFTPPSHRDSGGGSAQFERKGADNSIQEAGSEAAASELQAAAAVLHAYLDARAAGAWGAACSQMTNGVAAQLAQLGVGGEGDARCPELLAALSGGLPPAALREAAIADVGALRVDGAGAFILFHGARNTDYFMPMARQSGEWKIAALAPSPIP